MAANENPAAPRPSTSSGSPLIVVGVDGSACSREALRFAVEEARLRHARVRIVTAWAVPTTAYAGMFSPGLEPTLFEENAAAESRKALDSARELAPELAIDATTPNGPASAELISAAGDAALLVVGSRGHGGFAGLLLGSVSQQLAQHAPCPVVIIHAAG
jgi:nucleotide-binding universal stress UspA family protein